MNQEECDIIMNLLPEWARGAVTPAESEMVQVHLESCPECREALDIVQALQEARPAIPEGLETRVQARLREEFESAGGDTGEAVSRLHEQRRAGVQRPSGGRRLVPAWAMSAAAILVLAIGTKVVMDRAGTDMVLDPIAVAAQEPLPESWLWDDGMVAGAPVLDGLSDEDLEALLEELEG